MCQFNFIQKGIQSQTNFVLGRSWFFGIFIPPEGNQKYQNGSQKGG